MGLSGDPREWIDALQDVVYVLRLEPDMAFEFISNAVTAMVGYTPEEHYTQPDLGQRILDPRDVEALTGLTAAPPGRPVEAMVRWRSREGSTVWTQHRCVKQRRDDGSVAIIGSARDVTALVNEREELARQREEYRLLAENASDVVFRGSNEGVIEWVSDSVEALLGASPERMAGRPFADFVHPDDMARVRETQAGLLAGQPASFEVRVRTSDGGWRWVAVNIRAVTDASGQVVGRVGGWRDIQAEVEARQALTDERALLRATIDADLDPHVLLRAVRDHAGRIVDFAYADANDAACAYNQLPRDQLLSTTVMDLLPGHASTGLLQMYITVVETGEPLVLDDYQYPHEILAEPRRFDIRGVRVGDAISFTWRDVTDRHTAHEALEDSEGRYRLLAENTSDVVLLADRLMNVEWASPSVRTLLGRPVEDVLGQGTLALVHPEDLPALRAMIEGSNRTGSDILVRFRWQQHDGHYLWVEAAGRPLTDGNHGRGGRVLRVRDIEAQVASESALQAQARTDALTGLVNRAEALTLLKASLTHAPRAGRPVAVVYLDLDSLKEVNDTRGHAAGDVLLSTTAARIALAVRDDDVVARIGGDELLVVLAGVADLTEAADVAEKVRSVVAQPVPIPGGAHVGTTVSAGVTLARRDDDVDTLVARADAAMYEAKRSGRNQVMAVD